jgi:hypothetical protein
MLKKLLDLMYLSVKWPKKRVARIKPKMYPPVAPNPLAQPENQGTPAKPSPA